MIKAILLTVVSIILAVSVLYLLMIMPRMLHRPDSAPFAGVLYAHRGLHDNTSEAPENSMAAFQKAVDAGFGIELDVQLSFDKVPVVFHDFSLARACGAEGKVADYTYEELQQFTLFDSDQR
ncbi:MAG: glycerophosphodiester phosphodiesterase, partial [Lachnospiraceae bacterium]|nr:glycerophosphodiester phosphodiesterase [Lachnospiraceae bacterium]